MSKKFPEFQKFGEYPYYAYANLQMLHYALKDGKPRYDRMCYMIRAKAYKAYKEGKWQIHDLFEFNITNGDRYLSLVITGQATKDLSLVTH